MWKSPRIRPITMPNILGLCTDLDWPIYPLACCVTKRLMFSRSQVSCSPHMSSRVLLCLCTSYDAIQQSDRESACHILCIICTSRNLHSFSPDACGWRCLSPVTHAVLSAHFCTVIGDNASKMFLGGMTLGSMTLLISMHKH